MEVIASSVAGKTTESLIDRILGQIQYLFSYHENIDNLKRGVNELGGKTARVKESVEEAKRNLKSIYEDVEKWLKRVEEVKEEANGVLEGNVQKTCFYCRCPNIKSRYSLSRKAKQLSFEVQTLIEKSKFDEVGYRASIGQTSHLLPQVIEKFASRSLTMKKVLESLKDPEIGIFGICGMPGVGKTKLAMEISNRVKVEKSFDEVAFATVSQTVDVKKIQGEVAAGLRLDISDIKDSAPEIAKRISERLRLKDDERILVILDDVWADPPELTSLGIPFENGPKGLKVMLTSRFKDVCERMGAQRIIEVEVLKEEEAWLLLKEISGISDDGDEEDLKHLAKEVAKECGGLPLAIVCIGGLLKNKKSIYVWRHVLGELRKSSVTNIKGEENLAFSRIKLSYEALKDKDYKSLLLFCSSFPEDYEIPIEKIVRYVKGLEIFDPVMTLNEMRDKVYTIVDHLTDCYLLFSSTREREKHVKLHDAVRDVCLSIMGTKGGEPGFMLRHVCRKISPGISTEDMNDLKVLDVKIHYRFELPPLGEYYLTSLRTLCLEECDLKAEVITFVERLKRLEVLSFYKSILPCFPKRIAKLTNLKLLDLRFRVHYPFPSGTFLGLKKLEELYMGYYEPENKEVAKQAWIKEAHSLSNLTTFQVEVHEKDMLLQILRCLDLKKMERFHIYNRELLDVYRMLIYVSEYAFQNSLKLIGITATELNIFSMLLKKSYFLELNSPNLEYIIDANHVQVIQMDGLRKLESLKVDYGENLKGLCRGRIQPPWLYNLKRVSITGCNAMTSLFPQSISKSLMNLEELKIIWCDMLEEVICKEENTDDQVVQLPHLKTLTFDGLTKFQGFCSGNLEVSFPELTELKIWDCPRLNKFCCGKLSAPSLQQVRVTSKDNVPIDLRDKNIIEVY